MKKETIDTICLLLKSSLIVGIVGVVINPIKSIWQVFQDVASSVVLSICIGLLVKEYVCETTLLGISGLTGYLAPHITGLVIEMLKGFTKDIKKRGFISALIRLIGRR